MTAKMDQMAAHLEGGVGLESVDKQMVPPFLSLLALKDYEYSMCMFRKQTCSPVSLRSVRVNHCPSLLTICD